MNWSMGDEAVVVVPSTLPDYFDEFDEGWIRAIRGISGEVVALTDEMTCTCYLGDKQKIHGWHFAPIPSFKNIKWVPTSWLVPNMNDPRQGKLFQ